MPSEIDAPAATVAWIESPFQFLSLIEATRSGRLVLPVRALLRQATGGFDALLALLEVTPVEGLSVEPAGQWTQVVRCLSGGTELAVADLFSGQVAMILLQAPHTDVVVLDDGSSTLTALGQLMSDRGALLRPRSTPTHRRQFLARATHRRLRRRLEDGVRVVTGLPVQHTIRSCSVRVDQHQFAWSRSISLPWGLPDVGTLVLGSALAADGLIRSEAYDEWIDRQFESHDTGRIVYLPHRRDDGASLATVRRRGGVVVSAAGLPVELIAPVLGSATRVSTLPSTTVLTLPVVAPHVDVECWDVPDHWWTPGAPEQMRALLASVCHWHQDRLRTVESLAEVSGLG